MPRILLLLVLVWLPMAAASCNDGAMGGVRAEHPALRKGTRTTLSVTHDTIVSGPEVHLPARSAMLLAAQ